MLDNLKSKRKSTSKMGKKRNITTDCGSEVVLNGYKEQLCHICGAMLLPCALCDAYSDNPYKIFANSCKDKTSEAKFL